MNVFDRLDAALELPPDEAMLVESVRKLAAEWSRPARSRAIAAANFRTPT